MGKSIDWSYKPYKPFYFNVGDIYICRVVPGKNNIYFEWLSAGEGEYLIYVRKKETEEFILCGSTAELGFSIENLETDTDYEFKVEANGLKSRIRLAHTGEVVGTVVNYLHPKDEAYSFSGNYLASPSLVRHPIEGYLLASMDVFGHGTPQNLTMIFRSDDEGKSWHHVSELYPCFWGKMFFHKGELYMLSCSNDSGDLLIGKSIDGGKTFSAPTVLMRGSAHDHFPGIHKNPQNVVHYKGRIYETLEWGSWCAGYFSVMVMSCDENADLLDAENWVFSKPVKYNPEWEGVAKGQSAGNIEGTLCVAPDGGLYSYMRYDLKYCEPDYGLILVYKVDAENPANPLTYVRTVELPANNAKFMIKYDDVSKLYYSIVCRITDKEHIHFRNLLSLMVSKDLTNWEVAFDIYNKLDEDKQKVGMQYCDFEIEGDEIIFLCRTAMNGADNYHDSNYQTFHRIKKFREFKEKRAIVE